MSNALLYKSYLAGAAISPYRIVKFSAAETVIQAAAATDSLLGINGDVAPTAGQPADITEIGIQFCEAGAAIALGAFVTSDAVGRGVTAAPATGVNNQVVGKALESASAAGDIIRVLVSLSMLQG